MKIDLYVQCWNEERFLPFFLQHYNFVDRIFVYDNMSTDDTARIAASDRRCSLIRVDTGGTFNEQQLMDMKNQAWKYFSPDADWVFVVDTDEFIFHKNIIGYLSYCSKRGATRLTATGYSMYSPGNPTPGLQLVSQVQRGVPFPVFDKSIAFDPKAFEEMNFHPGQHWCEPVGNDVELKEPELKLLHMTYVGNVNYRWSRISSYNRRLSQVNRDNGWGEHYSWPHSCYMDDVRKIAEIAEPVI